MEKTVPVTVRQVGNGYLVEPELTMTQPRCLSESERMVFQSMQELQQWLAGHFTHRAESVRADKA